jgi:hypothetical protein
MRRNLTLTAICVVVLSVTPFAPAKEKEAKSDPLTGTWDCMSHGSSQGDVPFTLQLELDNENVTDR